MRVGLGRGVFLDGMSSFISVIVSKRRGRLPDSFGYNGAMPQLLRLAGMDYFFTQKLSWCVTSDTISTDTDGAQE